METFWKTFEDDEEFETAKERWEAVASRIQSNRTALQCVEKYRELCHRIKKGRELYLLQQAKSKASGNVIKRGQAKHRSHLQKRELEEKARIKKKEKEEQLKRERIAANGGRLSAEDLGFFYPIWARCGKESQCEHGHLHNESCNCMAGPKN